MFGLTYCIPLVGMGYAHVQGSAAARRTAALAPLAYHLASAAGVVAVFPHALNPAVAPIASAVTMHLVYAALCAALVWAAEDEGNKARR